MKYSVKITVKENFDKLYICLMPEIHEMERGSFTLKKEKDCLNIMIKAKDSVALRALTNSITQMLTIFEKTGKLRD